MISTGKTGNLVLRGTGYLFFQYWQLVNHEPAINVEMVKSHNLQDLGDLYTVKLV